MKATFPHGWLAPSRFALRGDRDQTRRKEQEGGNDVCRLYWLGVELSHGQALSLGRQIAESIDRERLARTQAPDPEEPVTDTVPVLKVVAEKLVVAASFDAGQIRTPSDLRFGSGAVGRTQ